MSDTIDFQFANSCSNFYLSTIIQTITRGAQDYDLLIKFDIHKGWFSSDFIITLTGKRSDINLFIDAYNIWLQRARNSY